MDFFPLLGCRGTVCVGGLFGIQVCGSCTFHFVRLKLKKCIARINGIVHSLIKNPHAFEFAYLTAFFMDVFVCVILQISCQSRGGLNMQICMAFLL